MSSDSFEMCRTQYDLKTTTHKHTRLHFMTSFRYKQHVEGSSSDLIMRVYGREPASHC